MKEEFSCSSDKSCCGQASAEAPSRPCCPAPHWQLKSILTPAGLVPRVRADLQFADSLGTAKARVGINRMRYSVRPGVYAVGNPTKDSPVLVSANYKMSFDHLRSAMAGRDAWIMVLDTKGINVWCAAGKGTFGTDEIVNRISATNLDQVVAHGTLILPQLGAPGVAAHRVKERTGFRVVYGPVRANDLPAFLDAGMKATPEMRRIRFTFRDRLVLVPMELVLGPKYLLLFLAALFFLGGLGRGGYWFQNALTTGLAAVVLSVLGFLGGAAVAPMLLPWLPGRAFSIKGAAVGLVPAIAYAAYRILGSEGTARALEIIPWFLIVPALAAFYAMNFTGSSTYTSLSGVKKEMRVALPVQIAAVVLGIGLWIAGRFV